MSFGFSLHPNVYHTGREKSLLNMLEHVWVSSHKPGDGCFYLISGFANYNGGVRFYEVFRNHIKSGGKVLAILGGSTSQRLSSSQVVQELLDCGAEVRIVNRKRILHAKCYGTVSSQGQSLIVSSGNFTGPGVSQNAEASLMLNNDLVKGFNFSWPDLVKNMLAQKWDIYSPSLTAKTHPVWKLLYNEFAREVAIDESHEVTLVLRLGHNDTARIQAEPGTNAGLGSQYFWLSRDCFDFFPPLTIRNKRGEKATFSTLVNMYYADLGKNDPKTRVTFEAENNLDFRLGTGLLRYTKVAKEGDLAAISRIGESHYQLNVYKQGTMQYNALLPYTINFIGHQGKKYGFISNQEYEDLLSVKLNYKFEKSISEHESSDEVEN